MDNKLSELSKPAGHFIEWQDEETGEREWCECSKENGAPLYSQEYVSALLADNEALKIRVGQQQSVAANNLDMFRKADARAETAEQNMELHFKAIEAERGLYRLEREAYRNHIAELEAIRADASQVFKEIGSELGCNPDNESIMMAIDELKKRLATPVRLQSPWEDNVGNRWLLEGTTADAIRAAGFKCVGDE